MLLLSGSHGGIFRDSFFFFLLLLHAHVVQSPADGLQVPLGHRVGVAAGDKVGGGVLHAIPVLFLLPLPPTPYVLLQLGFLPSFLLLRLAPLPFLKVRHGQLGLGLVLQPHLVQRGPGDVLLRLGLVLVRVDVRLLGLLRVLGRGHLELLVCQQVGLHPLLLVLPSLLFGSTLVLVGIHAVGAGGLLRRFHRFLFLLILGWRFALLALRLCLGGAVLSILFVRAVVVSSRVALLRLLLVVRSVLVQWNLCFRHFVVAFIVRVFRSRFFFEVTKPLYVI